MPTCPDCEWVEKQIEGKSGYEIIDIGSHVRCFVLEDGRVTLIPEEAGLQSRPAGDGQEGASCSIDGSGC